MYFGVLLAIFVATLLPLLTTFLLSFVAISSQPLQLPSPTLIVCTTITPLLNTWNPLSITHASSPHHKLYYPSLCLVKLSQVLNDTMLSPCFCNGNSQLSFSSLPNIYIVCNRCVHVHMQFNVLGVHNSNLPFMCGFLLINANMWMHS